MARITSAVVVQTGDARRRTDGSVCPEYQRECRRYRQRADAEFQWRRRGDLQCGQLDRNGAAVRLYSRRRRPDLKSRNHAGKRGPDRASARRRQHRLFGAGQSANGAFDQFVAGRNLSRQLRQRRGFERAAGSSDSDDERRRYGRQAGGTPTSSLNDGDTATYEAGASNPSSGTLAFDYTVGSGDETANLEVSIGQSSLGNDGPECRRRQRRFLRGAQCADGPSGRAGVRHRDHAVADQRPDDRGRPCS